MPAVLSDPVVDVAAAVDKLRADDRLITSPDMLLCDTESLLESITALQAVVVRRLRAARDLDATVQVAGRSTKRWLIEDQCMSGPEASRLIRLMQQLPAHPLTEAAFDGKEISATHACAILSALAALPTDLRETVEPHLVERARCYPPEELSGFVDELLQRLGIDKDGDIAREKRHASRGVNVAKTIDGTRSISGTLTPDVGERVETAIAHAAQKTGPDDNRTHAQRRHDALGSICDSYLAHQEPSFAGAPRTVIVTMDLETLENQLRERLITLPSGATISAATARRLACDAEIIPVVLGTKSEVLDIGEAGHEFTTAVRRAAYLRDGGKCAFPKCGNTVDELHHIVFRRNLGTNSLHNAAWLCAFHHWLVHEGGWTLRRATHGGYLWTDPSGHQHERFLDRHT